MPMSPQQLFASVGCSITGSCPWGTKPETRRPGVYIISLRANPSEKAGVPRAPISQTKVAAWIERVESLTLDSARPSATALSQRLARYWLPDEAVVYIGKATSLRDRLGQYYSTPLGDRRPHAGGHWVKTLSNLKSLTVHYTELDAAADPEALEGRLLRLFAQGVSKQTRAAHPQSDLTIPFANLEVRGVGRRDHGIRLAVLRD